MSYSELMKSAQNSLSGKWGLAIGTFFLFWIIASVGGFIWIVIGGAFALGTSIFSLNIARDREAKVENLFEGFNNFGNAFVAYLLMIIFVLLWSLLLIIPGIIAALAYSQTFFIMADDPTISPTDALNSSRKMMDGHKMRYFGLSLLFGLMAMASALLLFIPLLWLIPFMYVTYAKFYEDIKENADTGVADLETAPA